MCKQITQFCFFYIINIKYFAQFFIFYTMVYFLEWNFLSSQFSWEIHFFNYTFFKKNTQIFWNYLNFYNKFWKYTIFTNRFFLEKNSYNFFNHNFLFPIWQKYNMFECPNCKVTFRSDRALTTHCNHNKACYNSFYNYLIEQNKKKQPLHKLK